MYKQQRKTKQLMYKKKVNLKTAEGLGRSKSPCMRPIKQSGHKQS